MTPELHDELAEIAEAIVRDDYSRAPEGNDRLSKALREIVEHGRVAAVGRIDRVVSYTIHSNEVATACASIYVSSGNIGRAAQRVAATSEELSASVALINDAVGDGRKLAGDMRTAAATSREAADTAVETTKRSAESMHAAAEKANGLKKASEKISQIIGSIGSIAMQTNLLALNASVEAARAGEAGRGFAVVAQEVRALSEQTAKATADIRQMVGQLQTEVATISESIETAANASMEGREQLGRLGGEIGRLVEGVVGVDTRLTSISEAISEQNAAAADLAASAEESNRFADENLQRVTAANDAVDKLVSKAGAELNEVASINAPNKIARLAKADHVIWKKRLSDVFTGRLKLSERELSDHRCCRLGKWYYGPEAAPFRALPSFQALEAPHARVHESGIAAVKAFNKGDRRQALACMEEVDAASREVLRLLDDLVRQGDAASHRKAA